MRCSILYHKSLEEVAIENLNIHHEFFLVTVLNVFVYRRTYEEKSLSMVIGDRCLSVAFYIIKNFFSSIKVGIYIVE